MTDPAAIWRRICLTLMIAPIVPAHAAERGFSVTDFDRIRVEGPFRVAVETGKSSTAHASGDREALDRVTIQTEGRTLILRADRQNWGGSPGKKPISSATIRLTTRSLRAITLIGGPQLSVAPLKGDRLVATVEGSGQFDLAGVDVDRFDLLTVGSGTTKVSGKAKIMNIVARGSARIEGAAMVAHELTLATESADSIILGAGRSATVRSSGAGETTILGTPACAVTENGAGRVFCGR